MFEESMRYDYPLTKDSVVLDVGAHKGVFSEAISNRYGCTIHAFEPVAEFRQEAYEKLKSHPNVKLHGIALGDFMACTAQIAVRGDTSGFYAESAQTQGCHTVTPHNFLLTHRIEFVDLLKLNVEGSEYPILEHILDKGLAKRFRNIQVQWHTVVPNYVQRLANITARLGATHELTYHMPFIWENWRLK